MNKPSLLRAPFWSSQKFTWNKAFFPLLVLIGLAGIGFVLYASRWGAALSDNSYFYIKPARDMLAGLPYRLSPHYAPALPYVLTAIGRLGIDPQNGIRYLNAFCFGLNLFLAGVLVSRLSGKRKAGLAAAWLLLLAQPMIEVHTWAMSEALFISLILGCFSALTAYFQRQSWLWLLLSAVLAGLAALTRYAGVAMIAAGTLALLLAGGSAMRRILSAGAFAVVSGSMFIVYTMGDQAASGEIARFGGLQLVNPSGQSLTDLLYNTLLWVAPGRLVRGREGLAMAGLAVVLVGLAVGYVMARKPKLREVLGWVNARPAIWITLLFALASLFLLYQANLSNAYRSPFDFRLLAPSHLALFLFAFTLVGLAWDRTRRLARGILLIFFVFLSGLYLQRAVDTLRLYHEEGMGFASRYWHESDAVAYLRSLPAGTALASTAPMGVYFASGREAKQAADLTPEQLADWLKAENGYLIFFRSMPFELYGKDEGSYLSRLQLVQEFSDSAVYQGP